MPTSPLDTMFANGMGSLASFNLGQQLQSDQAMAAAKLREQQLANDNAATMNPLNAQFRQGQIAEQGAQLPGIVGASKSLASAGAVEEATTPNKIAQRISSLGNQIGVDNMQRLGREGQIASQAAEMTKNYPPALAKEVFGKIYTQLGGDPNSPVLKSVMNVGDGDVVGTATNLGKGMAMASHEFMQKQTLQKEDNASKERIADTQAAATLYAAKIAAESRISAAQARAQAVKHMTSDQAITYLEMQPDRTPEENEALRKMKEQRLKERAAGANAVPASILNLPTPLQNAEAAAGGAPAPNVGNPNVAPKKQVVRTGKTADGRKVIQYSDGSIDYAN